MWSKAAGLWCEWTVGENAVQDIMDTHHAATLPIDRTQPSAATPLGLRERATRAISARRASYAHEDDASLIDACLSGDEGAWEKLVQRYGPLVYSIPRRLGMSGADADDVLQNVFTIAFRHLNSLKNRQCLAAWLITITRRECLHHSKRSPEHSDLVEEMVDGGNHLSDQVELQQRRLLVHQALGLLDPTSQALLSALFLEIPTPSYEAIAKRLGMAIGSIGPARARCLKKLEAVLMEMDGEMFSADPVS